MESRGNEGEFSIFVGILFSVDSDFLFNAHLQKELDAILSTFRNPTALIDLKRKLCKIQRHKVLYILLDSTLFMIYALFINPSHPTPPITFFFFF